MAHEYNILEARTVAGLSEAVNNALREGWELWGNPFSETSRLYQAVVRDVPGGAREIPGYLETTLSEPAGFTVGVPETPAPEEHEAALPLEAPAAACHAEPRVLAAIPFLHLIPLDVNAELCCCFEVIADNPDCPVHKNMPVTGVRI